MRARKIRHAGLLLGIGLGGLLDGMLLDPVLQWHGVLSARWFHLAAWVVTLAGVIVLWGALRGPGPLPRGRAPGGWALIGWGALNLIAGAMAYDWIFLLVGGLGLIGLGYLLKSGIPEEHLIERRSGLDRRSASPLR